MRSHVVSAGLDYGLFDRVEQARRWLDATRPAPARVKIVGDDDSDGTTSAYVLAHALRRMGYDVEIQLMAIHTAKHVDAAMSGSHDLVVVADSGSAFVEYFDTFAAPVLILDHHRVNAYESRNVFEVNPRRVGGDQVDFVSASVVSQLFASNLDPENRRTAFAAVAGGIADRQHLSGFQGLIDYLVDEAVTAGHVVRKAGLTLPGSSVQQAIAECVDPYFDGLTGNQDATAAFLADVGIPSEVDPRELADTDARRLGQALSGLLERKGVVLDRVFPTYALMLPLRHASKVPTVFALTRILETLTAQGDFDRALKTLGGDAKAAARGWAAHRERMAGIVAEVERMRGAVEERTNLRVAQTRDNLDTGIYAHILLTYVFGDDKPFLAYAVSGGRAKFSARGSPRLFNAGVDLSIGMRDAAEALGGNGGGHPGASGAAVAKDQVPEFLDALDAGLGALREGAAA